MLSKPVTVSLTMGRCSIQPRHLPEARCFFCNDPLDQHQPDPDTPERLVGICQECGRWYLMDLMDDENEAVLVHLPGPLYFVEALGE